MSSSIASIVGFGFGVGGDVHLTVLLGFQATHVVVLNPWTAIYRASFRRFSPFALTQNRQNPALLRRTRVNPPRLG